MLLLPLAFQLFVFPNSNPLTQFWSLSLQAFNLSIGIRFVVALLFPPIHLDAVSAVWRQGEVVDFLLSVNSICCSVTLCLSFSLFLYLNLFFSSK